MMMMTIAMIKITTVTTTTTTTTIAMIHNTKYCKYIRHNYPLPMLCNDQEKDNYHGHLDGVI